MRTLIILILALSWFFGSKAYASMSEYCATPPFLSRTVAPNVMIILDNSGSMFNFAYDYNDSAVSTGFDPDTSYYGYFNGDYWYKYESEKFVPTALKSSRNKYSDEWDGNFLNWLTMRRVDVARKVLVGGKYSGGYLIGEKADGSWRGYRKSVDNAENYTPYSGTRYFDFDVGGSGTSRFRVCNSYFLNCSGWYNVKVKVDEQPEGIIQKVGDKVRWGLSFYHVNWPSGKQGGYVQVNIGGGNIENMINEINNKNPDSNTPLAETLWTVAGYFAQKVSASEMPDISGGPGPRYQSGDYQINNNVDPYNYGTGDSPVWGWCAKSFVIYITDGEPCGDDNLPTELKNYAANHGGYSYSGDLPSCDAGGNNPWIEDVALYVHTNDLRDDLESTQALTIYPVFAFGSGSELLKYAAINGGFVDKNNNNKPDLQSEWDEDGNGVPDNYFEAENGAELEIALEKALTDILRRVSSGTAASILAASEKSGANILQAIFYPKKYFENSTEADWIGKLQNLWFYLGPFMRNIREDSGNTNCSTGDKCFNLDEDKVVGFYFDNSTNETKVNICTDTNGNGRIDEDENATCEVELLEDINPIWEAGKVLWKASPTYREIFTWLDNTTYEKISFTPGNADEFKDYLDASNSTEASDIIKYIRGEDISGKRSRTVTMDSHTHVWKLGDIVYSTPKVISSVPLNTYHIDYHDDTYREFTSATDYKNRGMVFVGANDGMLHAFRLGKLSFPGGNVLAKLTKPDNGDFGSEAWAFIPKNALPYLKYYMDPSYCHLYYVDLTPYVFDASIGDPNDENLYGQPADEKTAKSWRTILIGGMNFGGACGGNATGAVHPPSLSSPATGVGKSSYFAMDVTNPENPQIMWEFTDNNTAFTTTGPAIIHIPYKDNNGEDDNSKNGYWYVVFASGPDNYDGTVHQPLYLYVLDLKTGTLKRKIQLSGKEDSVLGNINAFAGRFFESQADLGKNYSDDVLYFGYTYKGSSWDGGVLRLVTGNDPDVDSWTVSKLIDGIGPVTSGVSYLEDTNNGELWVYFGEGRYFTSQDDMSAQRRIYGVKDPCYSGGGMNTSCTASPLSLNDLTDVTNNPNKSPSDIGKGWYINLESSSGGYGAERVITDPVATTDGWVFYTTFMPTSDICGFGGNTYMWMVNYNNGGVPQNVGGVIFVQTSTGVIKKIELSKEFGTGKGTHGGRRLATPITGAPSPSSGITVIKPPEPLKSLIQWRETPVRKGK